MAWSSADGRAVPDRPPRPPLGRCRPLPCIAESLAWPAGQSYRVWSMQRPGRMGSPGPVPTPHRMGGLQPLLLSVSNQVAPGQAAGRGGGRSDQQPFCFSLCVRGGEEAGSKSQVLIYIK